MSQYNFKDTVNHITNSLRHTLNNTCLFDKCDSTLLKTVDMVVVRTLNAMIRNGLIGDYIDTSRYIMWYDMTLKKKIKWYVCNKLLKFIGRRERERVNNINLTRAEDELFHDIPYWATESPRSVLIHNIKVKLNHGVSSINVKITV